MFNKVLRRLWTWKINLSSPETFLFSDCIIDDIATTKETRQMS